MSDFAHGGVLGGDAEVVEGGNVGNILLGAVDNCVGAIVRDFDDLPLEHELEAELVAIWRRDVDDVDLVSVEVALDLAAAVRAGQGHVNVEVVSAGDYCGEGSRDWGFSWGTVTG